MLPCYFWNAVGVDGRVKILFHRRTCIHFAAVAGSGSTWRIERKKGKKKREGAEKNVARVEKVTAEK